MLVAIPSLVPLGRHQHRRATATGVLRKHSHDSHTRFTGPRLVLGAWVILGHLWSSWVNTALMWVPVGQLATVMKCWTWSLLVFHVDFLLRYDLDSLRFAKTSTTKKMTSPLGLHRITLRKNAGTFHILMGVI